jgi:glycosyltransferase involved in cell wall biosynthesis
LVAQVNRANRIPIGIPAWRAAGTIEETLESIQVQSGLDRVAEVRVVDDAGGDNTTEIARRCWRSDVPLVIETLPSNRGQWFVTNHIVSVFAHYPWVAIVHADDVLKPGWLDAIVASTCEASPDVATICTHYDRWIPSKHKVLPDNDLGDPRLTWFTGSPESVGSTLANGCWWHLTGAVLSTRVFQSVGGFDSAYPYSADWDWLLRVLTGGWTVGLYRESLMLYRMQGSTVSGRSMQLGLDIVEGRQLVAKFAAHSNLDDTALEALRRRRVQWCARRIVSRLARGQFQSAWKHLELLALNAVERGPRRT